MSLYADRVRDTTSTTGTGTVTLDGAPPAGFRAFSPAFATNDPVFYVISGGAEWEAGKGTLTAATTLTRDQVFSSSNGGALVSFSAGAKTVICDASAVTIDDLWLTRRTPLFKTDFSSTNAAQEGGWTIGAISTGTFTTVPAAGVVDGNHPGVVLVRSSTTANSGIQVLHGIALQRIAGGEQFDHVLRTPAALTNLTYRFGFLDTATNAAGTDGFYFLVTATGVVTGVNMNNTTQTNTATLVTLAASTWYHFRIVIDANASRGDFFIYSDAGTQLGTGFLTGNIPTAAGRELGVGGVFTNSGTTAVDIVNLDYMAWGVPGRVLQRGALK